MNNHKNLNFKYLLHFYLKYSITKISFKHNLMINEV